MGFFGDAWDFIKDAGEAGAKGLGFISETRDEKRERRGREAERRAAWDDLEGYIPDANAMRLYQTPDTMMNPNDPRIYQGQSEMAGVNADPRAIEAQAEALRQLGGLASTKGLTDAERARLEESLGAQAQVNRGQQQAVLQNMQMRGMGGSGAELAARLQGQQQAAQIGNQGGLQAQQMAQQRQMGALQGMGNLSTNMRGQSFDEGARKAESQDEVNRFNTGQYWNAQAANKNWAQQAAIHNASVPGQLFGMHTDVTAGRDNQFKDESSSAREREKDRADRQANTAGTVATIVTA